MLLFLTVLKILFPVFFLGLVGFIWSKLKLDYPVKFVTSLTMNLALPSLIFVSLLNTNIDNDLVGLIIFGTVLCYLFLTISCYIFIKFLKIDNYTFLHPMIFGNTGYVGLPLAFFSFGNIGLGYAIIIFAIMAIYSFTFGIWFVSGKIDLKHIFKEPIVLSSILGVIALFSNFNLPEFLQISIELISQMAIPLMLVTLGVSVANLKINRVNLSLFIVLYRTLVGLLISILIAILLNLSDLLTSILILQITTPIAVTSYILSEKYKRNPSEVASLVVLSTVLSIFYIPIILSFLI